MYSIALVDDEKTVRELITSYFQRYREERGGEFSLSEFSDGLDFLNGFFPNQYDIIFMDIEMPFVSGMEIAHKIREKDENVTIIFATNMAQYAIEGYSVQAYRFVLKPVSYMDFSTLLSHTLPRIDEQRTSDSILITSAGQATRIAVKDITYVEIGGHRAVYHLSAKELSCWESMKSILKKLEGYDFALCNACYLVNLHYVKAVSGYTAVLSDGTELAISQSKKKGFLQSMTSYLGRH